MNVFSETEGKWVPASDEIELVNGGAIAARTQAKVTFLPNLNDPQPPISLYLPDGRPLRSQIVGLAYTERDTGKSVFISELKDSVGQVVGRNQVVYPDAFDSIKADVRYTVTQSFFEQDVIIREQLPSPEAMGLNPKTARLEVWTEFFDGPEPEKSTGAILRNDGAFITNWRTRHGFCFEAAKDWDEATKNAAPDAPLIDYEKLARLVAEEMRKRDSTRQPAAE